MINVPWHPSWSSGTLGILQTWHAKNEKRRTVTTQVSSCKACASEHPLRLMIPSANAVSRLKTLSRPILQAQKKDAKAEKLLSSWIFFQGSCFPFHSQSTPVSCVRFPRLVPTPAQSFQISCLKIQPFDIRSPVILGLKISFAINKPQMPDIAALLPVQNIAGSAIPPS